MITIPTDNILLITEEYKTVRPRKAGRGIVFELSGTFGSATVQPGYLSAANTFIADGAAKTAAGRVELRVPASGYPMLKVTGATGPTAILVTSTDVKNL